MTPFKKKMNGFCTNKASRDKNHTTFCFLNQNIATTVWYHCIRMHNFVINVMVFFTYTYNTNQNKGTTNVHCGIKANVNHLSIEHIHYTVTDNYTCGLGCHSQHAGIDPIL